MFPNQPQRQHFAEYLTGLIVAKNKSVSGINSEFVDTTDQSCLNRFVTAAEWDVEALNARRLELLQEDPATRYSDRGVIAIDDVLIDHDGKLIEDVGWFWDHASNVTRSLTTTCLGTMFARAASIIRWSSAASRSATSAKRPAKSLGPSCQFEAPAPHRA